MKLHTLFRPESSRDFLDRPILILESPSAIGRLRVEPAKASVTAVGPSPLLQQMRESDVAVFVRPPGKTKMIMPAIVEVHAPRGVTITAVSPAAVLLQPVDSP